MDIKIEENKYKFIELLRKIDRQGADIGALIYKLESSDFFIAPCSTIYHLNQDGGLCLHSLNVYNELCNLVKIYYPNECPFSEETLIIVSLLHDISKMNYYEKYAKNVKVYSETGKKSDELGKFDWVTQMAWKKRDPENRFVYGHHGQNSEYIANSYIPLTLEESAAITNHMGNDDEYHAYDSTFIYNRYPLAVLLHSADFLSAYIIETRVPTEETDE